jgi:hypothetical protein
MNIKLKIILVKIPTQQRNDERRVPMGTSSTPVGTTAFFDTLDALRCSEDTNKHNL